ncbi:recombinase family protein [Streptomyces sp. NPDC048340]|uniref:recombinase family protein n=1 Tax=Streptomyces sp. NPDC048340 TaxID=3365537 RepID=UPI003712482C
MTTASERLRLVAILRVSTKGQIDGYGLPAQRKDVKKWARLAGHRLVDILEDKATSGTEDEREELHEALVMLAAHEVDGILFPNMDRLARAMTVQESILAVIWAHNGRAFTADAGEILRDDPEDPYRTFVRQVMGSAAQLERGLIAKRLRGGRRNKAEKGGYAHGAPRLGWAPNGKKELVEVAGEQATRTRGRELRDQGLSYEAIGKRLTEEGHTTKRGGKWHASTVQRLLSDEARRKNNEISARGRQQKKEKHEAERALRVLGKNQ